METLFEPRFAVYTLPEESTTIPTGLVPVVPRIVETPPVILETSFKPWLAVYTLPVTSTTIPAGLVPVAPRIEASPAAVIRETLFEPWLAVYTLPVTSNAIPAGLVPVAPRSEDTKGTGSPEALSELHPASPAAINAAANSPPMARLARADMVTDIARITLGLNRIRHEDAAYISARGSIALPARLTHKRAVAHAFADHHRARGLPADYGVAEESDGSIAWFPRLGRNRQATLETTNATTTATTVPHDIVAKTAAAAAKPLYFCLET